MASPDKGAAALILSNLACLDFGNVFVVSKPQSCGPYDL